MGTVPAQVEKRGSLIAHEIRTFQVTIPPSTVTTAPFTQDVSFPPRIVNAIRWKVPKGAVGLMGWRLTSGGVQVIPNNAGAWIIADGESDRWELEEMPDGGKWDVTGYNFGNQPHSIWLTFHLSYIRPKPAPTVLLAPWQLAPVPDLSAAGPPVARGPA
jgi:hypothetical protein